MAEAAWLPSYISQTALCKQRGWRREKITQTLDLIGWWSNPRIIRESVMKPKYNCDKDPALSYI